MAISRYNISILLYISMGGTRRLPRRALRFCPPRNDKKEGFRINKLVGATIRRPQAANGRPYIHVMWIFA